MVYDYYLYNPDGLLVDSSFNNPITKKEVKDILNCNNSSYSKVVSNDVDDDGNLQIVKLDKSLCNSDSDAFKRLFVIKFD